MESNDLRVFEAVARLGSITAAAEELHTVQSNVTARVRLLEDELGVDLFRRHSRGVALTPAGEVLLPYATRVLALLREAANVVADQETLQGRLRIGSLESTAGVRLPPILAAYRKKYPKVNLVLDIGTTGHLLGEVLAGRLDAAFVAGAVQHPDIFETQVFSEEMVIVTSPKFRSIDEAIRSSSEVKILVLREGCSYRARLAQLLKERGVAAVTELEFGAIDGIYGCAREGLGITMMPRSVSERAARSGKLGIHSIAKSDAMVPTMFIRRRDAAASRALSGFLECALAAANLPAVPRVRKRGKTAKTPKTAPRSAG